METYAVLQLIGWVTVGFLLFLFAATGGFDLGAGMLSPFIGKTNDERRVVINTVAPTWDGNQVWLVAAGGALFAIWPRVYAASFSGFYFAFLLVLWSLFLRPVSFEYRSKMPSQRWRTFWDWGLCVGSFVPALIIGVGVGNLFLGVPFQYDPVSLRFFYGPEMQDTNAIAALFGLLRPFALLAGVVSVVMMLMHGAAYLTFRTKGVVYQRAKICTQVFSWLVLVTFVLGGVWIATAIQGYHWTAMANPMLHPLTNEVTQSLGGWLTNYTTYPIFLLCPILGIGGALFVSAFTAMKKHFAAFCCSCASVFGIVTTAGVSLFPFVMPSSTHPAQSLLVWNATSSQTSLIGILVTAVIMVPVIFYYTAFVYRKMWGRDVKMSPEAVQEATHTLY